MGFAIKRTLSGAGSTFEPGHRAPNLLPGLLRAVLESYVADFISATLQKCLNQRAVLSPARWGRLRATEKYSTRQNVTKLPNQLVRCSASGTIDHVV